MSPELVSNVNKEEYDKAGSKFIVFSPDDEVGKLYYKDIEMDMPDWETPGQSYKFPVRITEEGMDFGKEDKIVGGATATGIWKTKDIVKAVTGSDMPMTGPKGKERATLVTEEIAGKPAVGVWQIQIGAKGGDPSKGTTKYPKLINIMPAGSKPAIEELV
jgi:hypothetical protein